MVNGHLIFSYFKFFVQANSYYRIHSPFVFSLIECILEENSRYYAFDDIEKIRAEMLQAEQGITVEDLGAGSKNNSGNIRSIRSIAKTAVSPAYQAQLLFKLGLQLRARKSIELGTSLGISSLYLSSYSKEVKLISLEGSEQIINIARNNFKRYQSKQIISILGHFDDSFPKALERHEKVDLVYIDGNHQYKATLKYFEWSLPYLKPSSVLIFDDIYWSKEMTQAWEEIKKHPSVKLSIDLFYFGLVFFDPAIKVKQDFKVVHSKFKPWQKFI